MSVRNKKSKVHLIMRVKVVIRLMRKTIIILGILLLVTAIGLTVVRDRDVGEGETEGEISTEDLEEQGDESTGAKEDSGFDFANTTYLIEGERIELSAGEYEARGASGGGGGATVYAELVETAKGDLNGDGETDGAAIVMHDPGGTALFFYLSGLIRTDSGIEATESVMIGDRIDINSLEIREGMVEAVVMTRAQNEPFAAVPTIEETLRFRLEGNTLVKVE